MGHGRGRTQDDRGGPSRIRAGRGGATMWLFYSADYRLGPSGTAGTEKRVRYGSETVVGHAFWACAVKG